MRGGALSARGIWRADDGADDRAAARESEMSVKEQAAFVTSTVATLLIAACGIATPDDEAVVATDDADPLEDAVDATPGDAIDIADPPDTPDLPGDVAVDVPADPIDDAALPDASGVDAEHDVVDLDADADTDPWACMWADGGTFWSGAGGCECDGSIATCCRSVHDDYSPYAVCATGRGEPGEWRVVGDFRDDLFSPCIDGDPEYPQCPR